jgi:hypothetical protein
LTAVSRALAAERRGSGLRIVVDNEGTKVAPRRPQKTGRIGLWSRKFRWVERAAAWDAVVDAHLRAKQLDAIEKMARKHAEQAMLAAETLMVPILAFAHALADPERRAVLENFDTLELFKLCVSAISLMPRLQEAERLARGVKVVDTEPVSNPGSTQGGVEWRLTVYQPERKEPPPDLPGVSAEQPDEWEEA